MLTKKYFAISEVCDICLLAPHRLRYIDKTDKNISIVKIRGRRYYTKENIEYLLANYSERKTSFQEQQDDWTEKQSILARIDSLLNKFQLLSEGMRPQ